MRFWLWLIGLGAVIGIGAASRHAASFAMLKTAFHATGSRPLGYSLNGWVALPSSDSSRSLTALVQEAASPAHLKGPIRVTQGLRYRKATVLQTVGGIKSEIIVERLASGATFLVMDRVSNQGFYGLGGSEAIMSRVLRHFGPVHMSETLEGTLPNPNMTVPQQSAIVQKALGAVGARPVSPLQTRRLVSVAGYTSQIPEKQQLSGKAVNIQVAVTANHYRHATEVLVGSPLITVTY